MQDLNRTILMACKADIRIRGCPISNKHPGHQNKYISRLGQRNLLHRFHSFLCQQQQQQRRHTIHVSSCHRWTYKPCPNWPRRFFLEQLFRNKRHIHIHKQNNHCFATLYLPLFMICIQPTQSLVSAKRAAFADRTQGGKASTWMDISNKPWHKGSSLRRK